MLRRSWIVAVGGVVLMAGAALAATTGTFGTVVPIGGQASDLALDEGRNVLYVADLTANRIDVMSLATNTIQTSINVAANPASLSMSPDGHWLLVAHFGNNTAPSSSTNALTLIDLTKNNSKQTIALGNPPLGVAFGADGKALIVTTQEYILFDPNLGSTLLLDTIANVTAKTLPVPPATFPGDITNASVAASGDGTKIFGLGSSSGTFTFRYDVNTHTITPGGVVLSSGVFGPRVVSLNQDGSSAMAGWIMIDYRGTFINQIPLTSNQISVGTTAFDNKRGLLYAHIPAIANESPSLQILTSDNLAPIDRLKLPENTTGKSVLKKDASVMYSVSASGVLVLPVGSLNAAPRLATSLPDLQFLGNFCSRNLTSQTFTITDPGGGHTPFTITPSASGVTVSPANGTTPATVTVSVDPNAFVAQTGTSTVSLIITSNIAVNVPAPVRVLINQAAPDQRGTVIDIPGTLVDVLADPFRNRYYVLRQDNNTVLVFDASNNAQIGTLRTYNTPTSMAITLDGTVLLVGHKNSQTIGVFNLDSLQPQMYIDSSAGGGNTIRSIAVSTKMILASSVDFKGVGHVLSIDPLNRVASQYPTLGVYQNTFPTDTVVAASPNNSKILIASSDGSVMLYDANVDSFTSSRKDFAGLSGAYAASAFDKFVVGANLLNSSLVPIGQFDTSSGSSSGFAFIDLGAVRTTAPSASSGGVVAHIDLANIASVLPTRMIEAPLLTTSLGSGSSVFTRTIAPLANRANLVSLTTSGITILPWAYDASAPSPVVGGVNSAADGTSPAAPGGLISIIGNGLSLTNLASSQVSLPTALANSCVSVNGQPMPLIFVSPTQVYAQMPFEAIGNVTVVVHTPGGTSDNFNITVNPNEPAVFLTGQVGGASNLPTVIRTSNYIFVTDSNPIHHGDFLEIYLTGLGQTTPPVPNGTPAPFQPLATLLTPPTLTLGGVGLPILFAGLAPGEIGVYQINVSVPKSTPTGFGIPLKITQGSGTQTINLRVVD